MPSTTGPVTAERIAAAIPLAHFPAGTQLRDWSTWTKLQSRASREAGAPGACMFTELRREHVFFYVGPSCFFTPSHCIGDAAMYLSQSVAANEQGSASPFDSGSLEPPSPHLQPWAERSYEERWEFLKRSVVQLDEWRERFRGWLCACYDSPERYLETGSDRYAAGLPDRSEPAEIREHNGAEGRKRHARCGDRRAWTWELRLRGPVDWRAHLAVLHVAPDEQERADDLIESLRARGSSARVVLLPDTSTPTFEALYLNSGPLLQEMIAC